MAEAEKVIYRTKWCCPFGKGARLDFHCECTYVFERPQYNADDQVCRVDPAWKEKDLHLQMHAAIAPLDSNISIAHSARRRRCPLAQNDNGSQRKRWAIRLAASKFRMPRGCCRSSEYSIDCGHTRVQACTSTMISFYERVGASIGSNDGRLSFAAELPEGLSDR